MADILTELQQKVAMKPALEAKLRELQNQRREYDREVISLRVAFRKEQEDVEKLEGRSLANYFFQVVGKLDEKLDQERREAYAAKVKMDAAERELAGIEADISEIQTQLNEIRVAEVQYKEELEKKRAMLKASGTAAADQIIEIEQKIAALEAQKQEIKEAISAGYSARSTADRILSELESADGWNTWDMFGGGGIITHMAKHSHLDEAQDLVSDLQSKLRRFKTELADIQITANMQVNVDGFLRFADYFFDGLFADWAVGDKISQSMSSVSNTKKEINRMLDKLNDMLKSQELRIGEVWNKKLNRMTRLQIVTPKHKELAALSSLESIVSLKKDVEGCIEKNQQFFNEILDVERIYVYGFSFSSIDMPYLEKIIRRTKPETHWVISWYLQDDKRRIMDFVIRYDIQNITMINGIKYLDIQV